MKKVLKVTAVAALLSLGLAFSSYAGQWKQGAGANAGKWWYDEENGTYATNGWRWIDGNGDGIAENYCFDQNGWLYVSTETPDKKTVDANGARVQDGKVVTKNLNTGDTTYTVEGTGTLDSKTYNGIEFSLNNLGYSDMAIGSIMYPRASSVTAEKILNNKKYYETGTDYYWMSLDQQAAVDSFVKKWKEENIRSGMSDEQKGRAIFDWMTKNIKYVEKAKNYQSSYGALIDRECVCGGYANGYMTLAKACGLEVRYVLCTDHAFNLVKFGEKWYEVDATWGKFKNVTHPDAYYMHTLPEGESSMEKKVEERKEKEEGRSQEIARDNQRREEWTKEAVSDQAVFYMDDENVVSKMLDYVYGKVEGKSSSQRIVCVLYTGEITPYEYDQKKLTYDGITDRFDNIMEKEIKGKTVNGFRIGDTSSCTRDFQENTGTDGSTQYATVWKDEKGKSYVLIRFNINPSR